MELCFASASAVGESRQFTGSATSRSRGEGKLLPNSGYDYFRHSRAPMEGEEFETLFSSRNRHRAGLAYAVLPGACMKAGDHKEVLGRTGSQESGTSEVRARWHEEEQPDFQHGIRVMPVPAGGAERELQLARNPAHCRPTSQIPAVVANLRASRGASLPVRRSAPPRSSVIVPIVVLSAISVIGYVAAVQSVAAFRSSWRSTDTRLHAETARQQAVFHPESGRIPGPFVPVQPAVPVLGDDTPIAAAATAR